MEAIRKTPSETEIATTLSHLKLSTTMPQKPLHKPKSKPVADSWDLESSGSDTETESTAPPSSTTTTTTSSTTTNDDLPPHPPPPTPASPTPFDFPDNTPLSGRTRGDSGVSTNTTTNPTKRPEKTTAVAGRLIAGALGVRAPRRTDEEREYDRATREKERKRRDEERARERREEGEREARRRAVWED